LPWVHTPVTFARDLAAIRDDPASRVHLWAWIDAQDAGAAFVAAARARTKGHERLFLSAPNSFSTRPSAGLAAAGWPDTPLRHPLVGRQSLIDASRARAIIGFNPVHTSDTGRYLR